MVFDDFELGKENDFKMFLKANPKPLHATWKLYDSQVADNSNYSRYKSSNFEKIEVRLFNPDFSNDKLVFNP